ncbi:MAG: calcium-binding protein [Acidimicrobiia bacterium]
MRHLLGRRGVRLGIGVVMVLASTTFVAIPSDAALSPTMTATVVPSDSTPGAASGLLTSLYGGNGFMPTWVTIHLPAQMMVAHADTVPGVPPSPVPTHPADGAILGGGDVTFSFDCVNTITEHWDIKWDEPFQAPRWLNQVAELRADGGPFGSFYVHVIRQQIDRSTNQQYQEHYDLATDTLPAPTVCGHMRFSNDWDPGQPIFQNPYQAGRYKILTESQPVNVATVLRSTTYFYIGEGTQTPPCTIEGTVGDDVLVGTAGNDVICGDGGNDTISGLGGKDVIITGNGNDTVSGGPGNDVIVSAGGSDTVTGDGGNDTVIAGTGNDSVSGGAGNDVLVGSSGTDTVTGNGGLNVVSGGLGTDGCSATSSTNQKYAYAVECESGP